jgi:purine-binding chemotaxis protein CheW
MLQEPTADRGQDKPAGFSSCNQQFIAFRIGAEEYAVDMRSVLEIKGWTPPTRLPGSPRHVQGVINLRGLMVPLHDLRVRFGGREAEILSTRVTLFVRIGSNVFGVVVDAVSDILSIDEDAIKPVPRIESMADTSFLGGIVIVNDRMIVLLDLDRLFTGEETGRHRAIGLA